MRYTLLLLFVAGYLTLSGQGQGRVHANTKSEKGYLIFLEPWGWFFQPANKNSNPVYHSLDKQSFRVRYGTDGYNNVLKDFEDNFLFHVKHTDTVFYKQKNDTTSNVGEIKYEYVELVYGVLPYSKIEDLSPCILSIVEVHNEELRYPLFCRSFEARIYSIKRLEK